MKKVKFLILVVFAVMVSCKPAKYADLSDGMYANMETNKGNVLLKLEFEKTPITVANFVSLAEGDNDFVINSLKGKPFYNGTVFHRVIPDFMIQGGDHLGTGSGNLGYKFKDEFPEDSEGNLILKHNTPGTLSMANAGADTNSSQFFITYKETPWLDGKHTVFGNVEKGQSVIDSIVQNDSIRSIEIIKIGRDAKSFKAGKVFSDYYSKLMIEKREKEERLKAAIDNSVNRFEENTPNALELPSGLKYVITETKNGEYPKNGDKVKVNYAGYFTDGKLFDTNYEEIANNYGVLNKKRAAQNGYAPFTTVYGNEARLISGFSEGLQKLRVGDKAILYIPSHLGYGSQGAGYKIPPNTDLVFEIEIVKIVK